MARLIDADALMKKYGLDNATKYGNKTAEEQAFSYDTMFMYEIADMIEDAPTIEAVKHGKWVWLSDEDVMCTSRGSVQNTNDNCDAGDWDFCPKCGAKVGGE